MTELDTTAGRRLLDAIGKATTGTDRLAALSSFRQWAAANAEALLAAAEERDRLRYLVVTPAPPAPVGELDVEALARALHAANVDCDYLRKFDRKSCLPGDGPHSILAKSIAIEYDRDGPSTEGDCTFHRPYSPLCGKPRRDPIHPGPGERMGNGRHVFRHEPES
jgi:hypothetical protein